MDTPDGDMGDIFENFFGGGFKKSGFQNDFRQTGGFGNQQHYEAKGSDIHAEINVSFDAAAFGKKETIHLKDDQGKIQALEVNIPAGIETGQSIRLSLFPEICRASSSADIWRRLRP